MLIELMVESCEPPRHLPPQIPRVLAFRLWEARWGPTYEYGLLRVAIRPLLA